MSEVLNIALSQLVLWYDPTRIQTWPALLAQIPEDMKLPSPTDFGRLFYTDRNWDQRHSAAQDIVRNLPGLEMKGKRLVLLGIGLLECKRKNYMLSLEARRMVRAYRADSAGNEWIKLLATQLLAKEPRTRMFIRLLSHSGARLRFTSKTWFGGNLKKAELIIPGVGTILPFGEKNETRTTLSGPLRDAAWWALGGWRTHELIGGAQHCRFVGQMKDEFSLHHIGSALRSACEVLLHLGILRSNDNECWLDQSTAVRQLGDEVAEDFGWEGRAIFPRTVIDIIADVLAKLRSDTGYIVAAELREAMLNHGVTNPDKEIGDLEASGRLIIEAESYGQSRHGVGLYSDPRKQLVKIRIR